MLRNSDGFTFTEALVAFNIVLVIIFTVVPIVNIVHFEREVLYDRRTISSQLHDQLQTVIYRYDGLPMEKTKTINKQSVLMSFQLKNNYIKACAQWDNKKEREEKVCLYGMPVNE